MYGSLEDVWGDCMNNSSSKPHFNPSADICALQNKRKRKAKRPSTYESDGKYATSDDKPKRRRKQKCRKNLPPAPQASVDKCFKEYGSQLTNDYDMANVKSFNNYDGIDENTGTKLQESFHQVANKANNDDEGQYHRDDYNIKKYIFENQDSLSNDYDNNEFALADETDYEDDDNMGEDDYSDNEDSENGGSNSNSNSNSRGQKQIQNQKQKQPQSMNKPLPGSENQIEINGWILDRYMNLAIYLISGIILIVILEQILQLGIKMKKKSV